VGSRELSEAADFRGWPTNGGFNLLQEGTDANAYSSGEGHGNVLQAAAFNGNKETVRMLLDAEANIFAEGYYESALDAAEGGSV